MKTSLDLLNAIQIPKPCPANWGDMIGDDYARFCGICEKHVYNLSTLSADEAAALVREKEGKLCVRLYRRLDGTVITSDCRKETTHGLAKSLTAAAVLASSMFVSGCSNAPGPEAAQAQNNAPAQQEENVNVGMTCIAGEIGPLPLENVHCSIPITEDPTMHHKEVLRIPPREVPARNAVEK